MGGGFEFNIQQVVVSCVTIKYYAATNYQIDNITFSMNNKL